MTPQSLQLILRTLEERGDITFSDQFCKRVGDVQRLGVTIKSILLDKAGELTDYPVEISVPVVPAGWAPVAHLGKGIWKWNSEKILIYGPAERCSLFGWYRAVHYQGEGKRPPFPKDYPFSQENTPLVPANSCLMDFLLTSRVLVKQEWRERYSNLIFMGTLYRDENEIFCFRSLDFGNSQTDSSWREKRVAVDSALSPDTGLVFFL